MMPEKPDTNVYFESTKSEHQHGGTGWEYGTCLWSPSKRVDGVDEYAIMRKVKPNDLIIHCQDGVITGYSRAVDEHHEVHEEPPNPGRWAKSKGFKSYYRIDVQGYTQLPHPIRLAQFMEANGALIRRELDEQRPVNYPFSRWPEPPGIRPVQGGYLTQCTAHLYSLIWNAAYSNASGDDKPEPPPQPSSGPPEIQPNKLVPAAIEAVKKTHFLTPDAHVARFLTSLATKPFVILTGNSGTGKTKLAQLLAHWLTGNDDPTRNGYIVVPVGADWTDNRNIVGFVNYLRKEEGQPPLFQSTLVLELLLRAADDRSRPYFLILDEMNLSHVERYFSDFLSAMESKKPVPMHMEASDLPTPSRRKVGESLPFPDNVFIIGTVNVDETTYMFSPKVLDRANVLEFRVSTEEAKATIDKLEELQPIELAPSGMAEAFLKVSFAARRLPEKSPLPPLALDAAHHAGIESCKKTLKDLFEILHEHRLEFAFRTIAEVLRYIQVDSELAPKKDDWRWHTCMDAQIFQKILPKLHGSKKKLEELLIRLAQYCETGPDAKPGQKTKTDFAQQKVKRLERPENKDAPDPVVFRGSYDKLCDMINIVRRDQFVSFIQ
jgi:hypothetical protein